MTKNLLIEKYVPVVRLQGGINTKLPVTFANTLSVTGVTTLAGGSTVGGLLVPTYEYVSSQVLASAGFAANAVVPLYTFPNDGFTWKVASASVRFTTAAGSAATVQVEVAASGTAPGSGTVQLTGGMALNGSANTVVNGTLITTPTTIADGAALSIIAGSTATTSLVGMVVTIALQRVS